MMETNTESCRQSQDLLLFEIQLEEMASEKTAAFFSRLAPTICRKRILGIRKPQLVNAAGMLKPEQIHSLLHAGSTRYYEEDILQIHFMNQLKTPEEAAACLKLFVPRINSWALCDGLTFPELDDETLLAWAEKLLDQPASYSRRLGLLWILKRIPGSGRDSRKKQRWIERAMQTPGDEKEVTDIKGWLLCEALIHDRDLAWPFFADESVSRTVRLCAIQKSVESRRICASDKVRLKALRSTLRPASAL